jgi:hypothetical protein
VKHIHHAGRRLDALQALQPRPITYTRDWLHEDHGGVTGVLSFASWAPCERSRPSRFQRVRTAGLPTCSIQRVHLPLFIDLRVKTIGEPPGTIETASTSPARPSDLTFFHAPLGRQPTLRHHACSTPVRCEPQTSARSSKHHVLTMSAQAVDQRNRLRSAANVLTAQVQLRVHRTHRTHRSPLTECRSM